MGFMYDVHIQDQMGKGRDEKSKRKKTNDDLIAAT